MDRNLLRLIAELPKDRQEDAIDSLVDGIIAEGLTEEELEKLQLAADYEPEIINSRLSRRFTWEGYTLQIEIYRLDDRPGWSLEVVNEEGTSIVWDHLFETDRAAYEAFRETLEQEGIDAFLDDEDGNVIPFPRRPH